MHSCQAQTLQTIWGRDRRRCLSTGSILSELVGFFWFLPVIRGCFGAGQEGTYMEQLNRTPNNRVTQGQVARQESPSLLVTVAEAARILCISQRTVYRMVERGQLQVIKVTPDTPRVRRADLEALVS